MQAYFKLRNDILDCGLTPNELKVAMCLYSCVFKSYYIVKIKQKTIAKKCCIKEAGNGCKYYLLFTEERHHTKR